MSSPIGAVNQAHNTRIESRCWQKVWNKMKQVALAILEPAKRTLVFLGKLFGNLYFVNGLLIGINVAICLSGTPIPVCLVAALVTGIVVGAMAGTAKAMQPY